MKLVGGLEADYARMNPEEAEQLLFDHYGVRAVASPLVTEKDDTFRIDCLDGSRLILKVANPAERNDEIHFEVALLAHVANTDPTLPVPRVIRSLGGAELCLVVDRAGQSRSVRLLTFLEGTPLDAVPSSPAQRFRVGELLGRLRLAMADFSHPSDSRVLSWDVRHLLSLRPLLRNVRDPAGHAQLERGLKRFAEIEPRVAVLRRQVLHNDFSRSNLIADPNETGQVTGIIDFGDAVRTAIAVDVSTALLNQLPRDWDGDVDADILGEARDVLTSYLAVAELSDEEIRLLPHLVMGRVVGRALITLNRANLFPENAGYILRNTGPGWHQLAWFLRRSPAELSESFVGVRERSSGAKESGGG
jgi:hydroxylysine kinase